ncbi:uncharacterized protein LOC106180404 [Lingula anatina]|uniref:Uncharacterized protein LOC106180404 n=1 Tax=Lingula anatina TaxID=7574 RepID=A0A1S3KC53_LINAN|nr:uncharacterized protein LOC106180404 [Lingula anatina]|eukprot:XP_013419836.1 uncharacterized protein LOC106180404 [Lingula anatina]
MYRLSCVMLLWTFCTLFEMYRCAPLAHRNGFGTVDPPSTPQFIMEVAEGANVSRAASTIGEDEDDHQSDIKSTYISKKKFEAETIARRTDSYATGKVHARPLASHPELLSTTADANDEIFLEFLRELGQLERYFDKEEPKKNADPELYHFNSKSNVEGKASSAGLIPKISDLQEDVEINQTAKRLRADKLKHLLAPAYEFKHDVQETHEAKMRTGMEKVLPSPEYAFRQAVQKVRKGHVKDQPVLEKSKLSAQNKDADYSIDINPPPPVIYHHVHVYLDPGSGEETSDIKSAADDRNERYQVAPSAGNTNHYQEALDVTGEGLNITDIDKDPDWRLLMLLIQKELNRENVSKWDTENSGDGQIN